MDIFMNYLQIEKVIGREILDSRGNPTVRLRLFLLMGQSDVVLLPAGPPQENLKL
jgi:enolase